MKNSLYLRLSAIFIVVLIILGIVYTLITTLTARHYFEETTQRLNAGVAEHMLLEVQPFVNGEVNEEALGKIMHSMMAVNPSIEVYLLNPEGEILSFVVLDKKVKLNRVSIDPVKEFLASSGEKMVLGDDPRNPKGNSIFSATPVIVDDTMMGYVYMVLQSEKFENITSTLIGSYALKLGSKLLLISLLAAFAIGMALIWLLTRNLRNVIQTVERFEQGDLNARIPEKNAQGELRTLSRTFNSMADTILKNIEELKNVDALRRELIANVSHDLRSPMAIIHGYIETLIIKEDQIDAQERKKYLETILKTSERLKKLVADLFELSRLETNQIEIKKEPFFINELLLDTSKAYELLANNKKISLEKEISRNSPMVNADVALIDRVLQNLLDNAIKYTPEEGSVKMKVQNEGKNVRVSIENTGEGIPEKDIPHIFDRYYKTGQHKGLGTGLGLAISKKILDIHNTAITVQSSVNGITSFSFSLPGYN